MRIQPVLCVGIATHVCVCFGALQLLAMLQKALAASPFHSAAAAVDLNKVSDEVRGVALRDGVGLLLIVRMVLIRWQDLRKHKASMEALFRKNAKDRHDPDFQYNVQAEFKVGCGVRALMYPLLLSQTPLSARRQPTASSAWDEDEDEEDDDDRPAAGRTRGAREPDVEEDGMW
jgi:hypothetical protein